MFIKAPNVSYARQESIPMVFGLYFFLKALIRFETTIPPSD
jgi:hypothetical protein